MIQVSLEFGIYGLEFVLIQSFIFGKFFDSKN